MSALSVQLDSYLERINPEVTPKLLLADGMLVLVAAALDAGDRTTQRHTPSVIRLLSHPRRPLVVDGACRSDMGRIRWRWHPTHTARLHADESEIFFVAETWLSLYNFLHGRKE